MGRGLYNALGQLVKVTDGATGITLESYKYDAAGNILSKTVDGKTTTYTYDKANQLVSSTAPDGTVKEYEYDGAGRMVKEGSKTYNYGWRDKVLSVSENGNVTAKYDYHADGQLASVDKSGKSEEFFWDGLALIKRGGTSYVNEPAVTGGNPILATNDKSEKVLFNDMLGSTMGSVSSEKYQAVDMTLFGESKTEDAEVFFTGKPRVDDLGYAFLFRNYRSNLGKWQTADPLGYPDGWNNKAYVNNRVVSCIDFLGAYEIEWEGSWTASEQTEVTDSLSEVKDRCSTLVTQINDAINELTSGKATAVNPSDWQALIDECNKTKDIVQGIIDSINSSTENLEIYKEDLGTESSASYWDAPVPWYDDELKLNTNSTLNWFTSTDDAKNSTMLHETSHNYGSHDDPNGDMFTGAHFIDDLWKTDFSRWLPYRAAKRALE